MVFGSSIRSAEVIRPKKIPRRSAHAWAKNSKAKPTATSFGQKFQGEAHIHFNQKRHASAQSSNNK